jgi:hypothetical protein
MDVLADNTWFGFCCQRVEDKRKGHRQSQPTFSVDWRQVRSVVSVKEKSFMDDNDTETNGDRKQAQPKNEISCP